MQSSAINSRGRFTWKWEGKPYAMPFNAGDLLTLARAVDEEGYPKEGVAWALIQRAAWLNTRGLKVSLGRLVEQYAQPINPAWFPNGHKHREEIARLNRLGDIKGVADETSRASRRKAKSEKPWANIDSDTKAVIASILSNKKTSPVKGAVHYWASRGPDFSTNQVKKPNLTLLDRGYGFGPGRNVFFADKGSQNFGGIIVIGDNQVGNMLLASINPMGIMIASAMGYAAWKWWV